MLRHTLVPLDFVRLPSKELDSSSMLVRSASLSLIDFASVCRSRVVLSVLSMNQEGGVAVLSMNHESGVAMRAVTSVITQHHSFPVLQLGF